MGSQVCTSPAEVAHGWVFLAAAFLRTSGLSCPLPVCLLLLHLQFLFPTPSLPSFQLSSEAAWAGFAFWRKTLQDKYQWGHHAKCCHPQCKRFGDESHIGLPTSSQCHLEALISPISIQSWTALNWGHRVQHHSPDIVFLPSNMQFVA